MKKLLIIFTIGYLTFQSYGQTPIQTKEVKIPYTNGSDVFNICISGCQTNFDDKKEYFWYSVDFGIKSTKGGCGGKLLHGKYQFFNEQGDLRRECNYNLGLRDGVYKDWNEKGEIIQTVKYKKDIIIYTKVVDEEKKLITETIGKGGVEEIWGNGTVVNFYNLYNTLLETRTVIKFPMKYHHKIYYDDYNKPPQLKMEFTAEMQDWFDGIYKSYYKNGKPEVIGNYIENQKDGIWTWYNEDGSIKETITFRIYKESFTNGKVKLEGSQFFDSESKKWIKDGLWKFYNEEGKAESFEEYENGEFIKAY